MYLIQTKNVSKFKYLQRLKHTWGKYLQLFMVISVCLQGEPGAAVITQSLRSSHCFQHHVTQLLLHAAPQQLSLDQPLLHGVIL